MSCVAFGCYNNSSKKIAGITFHRFPKEEILRKEWAKAVKRDNWNPSKHSPSQVKCYQPSSFRFEITGRLLNGPVVGAHAVHAALMNPRPPS
ncbi:hypothetical protein JTE90_012719 [Oedothorax gibbosus]|uniref:THAP-type domain-containing protein n=1 Tax=Oedothorax gibbosus TaxID=931172 RepID=A0AAV6W0B4_9ARAC|nr:hypothetical protein JTE90_012719 [Oedothorax gibbosus]